MDEAGFDFGQTWLTISYGLWAIAVIVGLFILGPDSRRVARQAAELRRNGVGESEELRAEASRPPVTVLGMMQLVVILALLWLMTTKPGV